MFRKFSTALISLVAAAGISHAADLASANNQYKSGDFKASAESYRELLKTTGPDANVFYNLGNSYQQLKQYGPAILAYERARTLKPRDPDVTANLARARKAAAAFNEPAANPRLSALIGYLSLNEWSWLVAGSVLFLGALALFRGTVKLSGLGARRFTSVSACAAGVAIAIGAASLYLRREETARGIVLAENSTVRLSPFDDAETVASAVAGRVVQLGEKNDKFQYVEIPGSNIRGWLAINQVEAVVPVDSKK